MSAGIVLCFLRVGACLHLGGSAFPGHRALFLHPYFVLEPKPTATVKTIPMRLLKSSGSLQFFKYTLYHSDLLIFLMSFLLPQRNTRLTHISPNYTNTRFKWGCIKKEFRQIATALKSLPICFQMPISSPELMISSPISSHSGLCNTLNYRTVVYRTQYMYTVCLIFSWDSMYHNIYIYTSKYIYFQFLLNFSEKVLLAGWQVFPCSSPLPGNPTLR